MRTISSKAAMAPAARVLRRLCLMALALLASAPASSADGKRPAWESLPGFELRGGLKAYWNVSDWSLDANPRAAYARGFSPITLLNTFADYVNKQQENINVFLGEKNRNPWARPPFFEKVVRRNILGRGSHGVFVNDIEFDFEQDARIAWNDEVVRAASGAATFEAFEEAYFRQWASWYAQPSAWVKEIHPGTRAGIYGVQPFRRDFYGIAGKTAQQIDGTHQSDARLWRYIDPFVDFYVASVYVFFNQPASVYYMAANVEENVQRTRRYGERPVYAYTWMRYHNSNAAEANRELDPWLVEAMAIVPYFSGARASVLWGHEPHIKAGDGQPYQRMDVYMQALGRLAKVSEALGTGRLVIDEPAHAAWNARRPLVRRSVVSETECVVMATNPWAAEAHVTPIEANCGGARERLTVRGKGVALFHVRDGAVTPH
ncbi:MAG: hypothetical protein JWN93_617 [Hyphomicrobiales bacterium]|nr:hypothetical protein [Hyphomicrobiales bacterium]